MNTCGIALCLLSVFGCQSNEEKASELVVKGQQALAAGALDRAAAAFDKSARLDPHSLVARMGQSRVLHLKGNSLSALAAIGDCSETLCKSTKADILSQRLSAMGEPSTSAVAEEYVALQLATDGARCGLVHSSDKLAELQQEAPKHAEALRQALRRVAPDEPPPAEGQQAFLDRLQGISMARSSGALRLSLGRALCGGRPLFPRWE